MGYLPYLQGSRPLGVLKIMNQLIRNFSSELTKDIKDDVKDALNTVNDIRAGVNQIQISQSSGLRTRVRHYSDLDIDRWL